MAVLRTLVHLAIAVGTVLAMGSHVARWCVVADVALAARAPGSVVCGYSLVARITEGATQFNQLPHAEILRIVLVVLFTLILISQMSGSVYNFLFFGTSSITKSVWSTAYQTMSSLYPDLQWQFMNYGYSHMYSSDDSFGLEGDDLKERYQAQLYLYTAGQENLRGKDVLEVGCGRGGGSVLVSKYLRPRSMTGMDYSPNQVEICRSRGSDVAFVQGDAENLPFDDNSFDAVVNVESSHCYPHIDKFLREVHRVLRPGGVLELTDFRSDEEMLRFRAAMDASPLKVEVEENISPNVLRACDLDHKRKEELIDGTVHWFLRGAFRKFAGLKGTTVYNGLRDGSTLYYVFKLRKA